MSATGRRAGSVVTATLTVARVMNGASVDEVEVVMDPGEQVDVVTDPGEEVALVTVPGDRTDAVMVAGEM